MEFFWEFDVCSCMLREKLEIFPLLREKFQIFPQTRAIRDQITWWELKKPRQTWYYHTYKKHWWIILYTYWKSTCMTYNIIVQTLVSILPQIYLLNTSKFNLFGLYTWHFNSVRQLRCQLTVSLSPSHFLQTFKSTCLFLPAFNDCYKT